MAKYQKKDEKQIQVDAIQWTGKADSNAEVEAFVNKGAITSLKEKTPSLVLATLSENKIIAINDWIVKRAGGEITSFKPEDFEATYVLVDDGRLHFSHTPTTPVIPHKVPKVVFETPPKEPK